MDLINFELKAVSFTSSAAIPDHITKQKPSQHVRYETMISWSHYLNLRTPEIHAT